ICARGISFERRLSRKLLAVIPGWSQRVGAFAPPDDRLRTRPQVRNCAPGNLEILRCATAHHSSLAALTPRNDGVKPAAPRPRQTPLPDRAGASPPASPVAAFRRRRG